MSRIDNCRVIELERIADDRGSLSFAEGGRHLPFNIRRIYYLYDVPDNTNRGAHAHRALHQFMIAISGSFDVTLDDGKEKRRFHLNQPNHGLYICPMMWRDLYHFSPGAVCLVLASEFYDENDYIRDYDQFIKLGDGTQ